MSTFLFPCQCELPEIDDDVGYGPLPETGELDEVLKGLICAVSSRPNLRRT